MLAIGELTCMMQMVVADVQNHGTVPVLGQLSQRSY